MDMLAHIVQEGSVVIGTGAVIIDASGDAHLAPNTPSPDPRQAGRTIPLRSNTFDLEWDGVWVTLVGRWTDGGVDVSSVDRVDRPAYPGPATVLVRSPSKTGWAREEILDAVANSDLHSTDGSHFGSGVQQEKNGRLTFAIDCLYIDNSLAQWLGHTHPGDIEVRSTLVPQWTN